MISEEKYLSKDYITKNPTWHIEDSLWKANNILKIITRNDLNPKLIGEIGCGAGGILHHLYLKMDKNISFVGYEISSDAFELCKTRIKERLVYKLDDMLNHDNIFYDIVMAIDVIEHIEDYFGFLRQFRKRGEYKIFHVPLEMSVPRSLFKHYILNSRKKYGHIQYFNKETILATLKETGYEVIDYFYTCGSLECISAMNFENRLLKIPRKIFFKFNEDITVKLMGGYALLILAK